MATKKNETNQSPNTLLKSMVIMLTLLTVVVGFLVYYLFTTESSGKNSQQSFGSLFQKSEEEKLFSLEEFSIMLSDGHYAKLSMSIGYEGKEEELKEIKPVLRDKIIFELMKLDETNLDVQHIEATKSILVKETNPVLKKGKIQHIYIDNLMVQ